MKNIMEYKGYIGSVEYSDEDETFFGQVLFINDVITFEGTDVKSLKEGFHYMVDDYLDMCKRLDKKPDKPFSGSFNIRPGSELHKKVAIFAEIHNKSINAVIKEALERYIA
ncbi:MAG: type II toxin-antitoxin system HicB family antitoxin [Candidatus Gastranaerophilaceae bacterium]|jgi:predicted HicB family RNase H-like nuclease